MIDSIISRHVTRSNTSFRPSCLSINGELEIRGNVERGRDRRGNSTEPPLSIFHSLTPPAGAGSSWRDFVFDRCAVASCVTTSICISNLRGWLSLSLSLHTPSFPSIHLAPSTVSLLFAPRDRFRRSVPIKAAAYCIQIGSKLSSFVVHPPCSFCCCRYVAPSCSLIKLHPSIL